jgi:hypothetical protein
MIRGENECINPSTPWQQTPAMLGVEPERLVERRSITDRV